MVVEKERDQDILDGCKVGELEGLEGSRIRRNSEGT